ncbi:FAD-dependent oxidoreductase [Phenylobacterium sp.]|uniref:FAD-dependent oxidoreductase n=1 Tax=Phenylobacterium sp. TaxID=1871053 RepID=UPI0012285535|nr:FAD-dependent oxidoreductase [Phenylobacterium sp.]THD61267.1 MAG: pyridine nucleotide-disulfide oxidoreductase [Phenylobacterium sp.]
MKAADAASVVDYLIVGGGPAGATAADILRREGAEGSVVILSADDMAPYHRQRLSKGYLVGASSAEEMLVHPTGFYEAHNIDLRLGVRVAGVDTALRQVRTEAGEVIGYRQLLLAPGAAPRRSSAPGDGLAGVHTLRGRDDADAIRAAAQGGRSAVVVGASYLGMEVAITLRDLGLAVTLIEARSCVLPRLEAPEVSQFFQASVEARGVTVRLDDTVERFIGADRVEAVGTRGGETLPADLVVVAVGVVPTTGFLKDSGVTVDGDGFIQADAMLRTNVAGVYAAGDAVDFYDPIFMRRRNVDHWDNAVRQGRLAARNMLGRRQRYDEVSYFYCEIGDLAFDALGMPEAGQEHIGRGALAAHDFALFFVADDVVKALFSLGRPTGETRMAESLIRYHVNVADHRAGLSDPEFRLDDICAQTVLVLQGGGALGAFECGVVKAMESEQIFPDVVGGVSIGALNGAIIAANPRRATEALESFWRELTVASPPLPSEDLRRAAVAGQILMFGVPNFFKPRWMPPFDGGFKAWTSFYDVSPMRRLIAKYVDFPALKASPVRLLIGAVDVAAGRLEVFDSYVDDLTADHVLASGSLPPGFPWTLVDGKAYWDGGIVSNSPLDLVTERVGPDGKQVYIVDLFSGDAPLPSNMMEVLARRDEIVYAERVHNDLRVRELSDAYREMIIYLLSGVDPDTRSRVEQHPRFIQLMGDEAATHITRFQRPRSPGEPSSRDYDFSYDAITRHRNEGYNLAKRTLEEARLRRTPAQAAARQQVQVKSARHPTKGKVEP